MRKILLAILPMLLIPLLGVSINAQELSPLPNLNEKSDSTAIIPEWVRPIAGWWSEKLIKDQEFVEALEWLINGEIIQIDSISIKSKMAVEEVDTESHKDKMIASQKKALDQLEAEHTELRKTHREYKDHYEKYADHETKQWYEQEFEKLKLQLNKIGTLESRNASLEEENENFGKNLNEARDKIAELEDKIRELESKVRQLEHVLEE